MTEQLFFQFAGQFGLPVALMAVAIYWLNRGNREAYAKLDTERSQRLDQLEKHITNCEEDRRLLWKQILGKMQEPPPSKQTNATR